MSQTERVIADLSVTERTGLLVAVNAARVVSAGSEVPPLLSLLGEVDRVGAWNIVARLVEAAAEDLRTQMLHEADLLRTLGAELS